MLFSVIYFPYVTRSNSRSEKTTRTHRVHIVSVNCRSYQLLIPQLSNVHDFFPSPAIFNMVLNCQFKYCFFCVLMLIFKKNAGKQGHTLCCFICKLCDTLII